MVLPELMSAKLRFPVRVVVNVYGCSPEPGTVVLTVLSSFAGKSALTVSGEAATVAAA